MNSKTLVETIKSLFLSAEPDQPSDADFIEEHFGEADESGSEEAISDDDLAQLEDDAFEEEQEGSESSNDFPSNDDSVELASVSSKPWSSFKESDYTDAQFKRACLIVRGDTKSENSLPIREPDGTLNKNAVHAAASRLNQVQASADEKKNAAAKLRSAYKQIGEDPPDSLKSLEDASDEQVELAADDDTPEHEEAMLLEGKLWRKHLLPTAYQLPVDIQDPVLLEGKRWRKHLLPLNKTITHAGEILSFSRDLLQEMVDSYKERAFDTVYATIGHTKDADKGRGVLENLFIKDDGDPETDGLYGDFEMSEDGEKIIKDNLGKIGTSVCYLPEYPRGDGKTFRNPLQHVAFTPTPAVPGLQPWASVALSEDKQAKVVDLTGATFASTDANTQTRKESEPVTELDTKTQENNEEVREVELTAEAKQAIELAKDEARKALEELTALRGEYEGTREELHAQKIERELDEYRLAGVPPADINLARPVLLAATGTSEVKYIELSEEGGATEKTTTFANQMRKLLDNRRGTIEFEQKGVVEAEPEIDDAKKIRAHAEANNVTEEVALEELANSGEVGW